MTKQLDAKRIVYAAIQALEDRDADRFKYLLDGADDLRSVVEHAIDIAWLSKSLACELEKMIREDSPSLAFILKVPPTGSVSDSVQDNLKELAGIESEGWDLLPVHERWTQINERRENQD